MHSNHFDRLILGAIYEGSQVAVEGTHRSVLRILSAKFARRLRLRLDGWRALAHTVAVWRVMPAVATCPRPSATRRSCDPRTAQRVRETRGPVGATW